MTLHADDLPVEVRRRLGLPTGGSKRTTRAEVGGPVHLRCHRCGTEFRHTTGARGYETHSDQTGHRRFEHVQEDT